MVNWKNISLIDLAGFISEELRKNGVDTVLVGGSCVTIYSKNRYESYDLDFVTYEDIKTVRKVLLNLGLIEKNNYFQHKDCPWFIEFVSPPVAVGDEPIDKFNYLETSLGTIKLLRPIDSVKDRLASFYHWNDRQALEQAVNICLECSVDFKEVKRWSLHEKKEDKFNLFLSLYSKKK